MSTFSNDLNVRKVQYQQTLINEGEFTEVEVNEMSLVELRAAIDELFPLIIEQCSVTMHGGKTKKVSIVKAA